MVMPAGVLTERGWKLKPKFKDGVAAQVLFEADVDVNDDEHNNDGDDPPDAHHLEARSHLGVWFVEA